MDRDLGCAVRSVVPGRFGRDGLQFLADLPGAGVVGKTRHRRIQLIHDVEALAAQVECDMTRSCAGRHRRLADPRETAVDKAEHLDFIDAEIGRSDEPAALEAAARIVTSGTRMARMIEDMLDLARARLGGGIIVKREAMDLKALVERVLREHQAAAPDQPIEAAYEGTFGGHWDSERVAQVASNLIGNAFKHGSPDAPVGVRLDGTRGDYVVLAVKNSGTIPPEILPHLFDPFRGGERQPGRGEGLGLGLYIVSQIVQAHDGAVDVKTGDGDETAFYVRLPRGDLKAS